MVGNIKIILGRRILILALLFFSIQFLNCDSVYYFKNIHTNNQYAYQIDDDIFLKIDALIFSEYINVDIEAITDTVVTIQPVSIEFLLRKNDSMISGKKFYLPNDTPYEQSQFESGEGIQMSPQENRTYSYRFDPEQNIHFGDTLYIFGQEFIEISSNTIHLDTVTLVLDKHFAP